MEILDVVDSNGNPTGKTIERTLAHKKGILHRTAHVWILRKKKDNVQILLQKRCMTKAEFPGCYDISSAGHVPAGIDYKASAVRELKEELGVITKEEDLIFCGTRHVTWDCFFHSQPFHDRQVSRIFVLWLDQEEEQFLLQESEVEGVLWMNFEDCITAVKGSTIPHCIVLSELEMIRALIERT